MSASAVAVLAADVGGTNTKLALARLDGTAVSLVHSTVYPSRSYASLEGAVDAFLNEPECAPYAHSVVAACFAVAGPVEQGVARLTNLTWQIDERALERHFSCPRVSVINDFAAAAFGIEQSPETDFLVLQEGQPVDYADRVIVGAGTGLGVASLAWNGDHYSVHPSEGGHSDFAPINALQDELLQHLRREIGRVSYERVLSGSGLVRVFDFLKVSGPTLPGASLLEAMSTGDPAGAIAASALAHRDPVAESALDLFVSAYGAFAGNMALIALAHGGVYVAGGIAPKIAAKLTDRTFVDAFNAKGRMRPLLETMPVKVVLNDHVGLNGALAVAARLGKQLPTPP